MASFEVILVSSSTNDDDDAGDDDDDDVVDYDDDDDNVALPMIMFKFSQLLSKLRIEESLIESLNIMIDFL